MADPRPFEPGERVRLKQPHAYPDRAFPSGAGGTVQERYQSLGGDHYGVIFEDEPDARIVPVWNLEGDPGTDSTSRPPPKRW